MKEWSTQQADVLATVQQPSTAFFWQLLNECKLLTPGSPDQSKRICSITKQKNTLYNQTHSKISVWTEIHNAVTPKMPNTQMNFCTILSSQECPLLLLSWKNCFYCCKKKEDFCTLPSHYTEILRLRIKSHIILHITMSAYPHDSLV